ncbi:MAG: DMT family transporter, partial [Mycobacterium sp.]|nr:DMT family transporter [Mycobacterium sp.]
PTVTVAKPVVASILGVLVLNEAVDADGPELFALIAAAALVIISTIALARGEAATMAAGAGCDAAMPNNTPSKLRRATYHKTRPLG